MAFNYENDVKRLGGNLQTTVAYLLSLHKNEYEWNLLGIKVVGHVDELPIPDGTYEYGDAYTVGTAAPYDMWIYTRADEFHSESYWFNIGKFPAPGPQGQKGDGLETIMSGGIGNIQSVQYDTAYGARFNENAVVNYVDSTTGMPTSKSFPMSSDVPILPGKYVSIGATSDNKKIEVKVDDKALALDYYKIDKTAGDNIPVFQNGAVGYKGFSVEPIPNSLTLRNSNGEISVNAVYTERIKTLTNGLSVGVESMYVAIDKPNAVAQKTSTDTGVFTQSQLANITFYKTRQIQYDNQIYYYMDPKDAPNGTINFVHLDNIEDGNGGYKATGKCFSITTSTREWKVFDLEFGGKVYQHAIHFELTGAGTSSTANLWNIELVITTSSPNQITKDTLYKYISTSYYPLQGGTPISVYREAVQGPQGMGIGRMAVQHEVGETSNTDHYIFELMSMDGISETITERDQNSLSSFVDTVTEV